MFTLGLQHDGRRVFVEVIDDNPRFPMTSPVISSSGLSGRGLSIVDKLSVEWGVRALPEGKAVWAALDLVPVDQG
jgi:hypothetical protein